MVYTGLQNKTGRKEFKNAAFFSTVSFSKTLLKVFENNVSLSFSVTWKTFLKRERFENDAATIVR